MMAHPLELAYNWRLPVAVSTRRRWSRASASWPAVRSSAGVSAAVVLVLCYAVFLGVVWGAPGRT